MHVQHRTKSDLSKVKQVYNILGNQTLEVITFLQNVELMLDGAES